MQTGLERLLADPALRRPLEGKRIALMAHPASVTRDLTHSLDALAALPHIRLTTAFGPQHGLRGEKQDNMVESGDYTDPHHHIPVHSLYGTVRRPTDAMMQGWDVLLFDLQDLGCRIYTFLTTLLYLLEACAAHRKALWVLDRPNPAGRAIEGLALRPGWRSFVGAAEHLPMRHGMTLGEMARWFVRTQKIDADLTVIPMHGWQPHSAPGYGWPTERGWLNPSPNAASLGMARAYAGTVMLEGTTLSEGRGTTRPLEILGAPGLDPRAWLGTMHRLAPHWMQGCRLRPLHFEPCFHKHSGQLCGGFQIHTEDPTHHDPATFRPWRLTALAFKALRQMQPDYPLWREHFAYEYEHDRLAIDLINGSPLLREWVDDPHATPEDLDRPAREDEAAWQESTIPDRLYSYSEIAC